MENISEWYMRLGNWVFKLFFLNILWVLFTLMGIVILGIFPATTALFAVTRKLIMQDEDTPISSLFWSTYKKEFARSNLLAAVISLIGAILVVDIYILMQLEPSILNQTIQVFLLLVFMVYLITTIYVFPIFVHFDLSIFECIKYAFVLVIGRPLYTMLLIICLIIISLMLRSIPGLIPVFGVSLFALVFMKIISLSLPNINTPIKLGNSY
ncbi:YesL family protein [Gracilibacillus sp. D59]|uniref:YesL family protein n=1 Tax=Gracilibacillus sp. D59 TaxID=3457434 RepID=UPI003FCEDE4E